MNPRLEIAFEVTRQDWIAVNEILMRSSPEWDAAERQHRRAVLVQMIWIAPVTIAAASLYIGRDGATRGMYLEGALAGLVLAALMAFGLPRLNTFDKTKRAYMEELRRADLSDFVGPTSVAIHPGGIEVKSPARSLGLSWATVTIREVGEYVFIDCAGGGTIIPRRAFPTPDDAAAFVRQAAEWWQAGQLPSAERIAHYLADRDVACPKCAYNLRGVRGERCPECGSALVLEELFKARQ